MTRIEKLKQWGKNAHLYVDTYSPGDGITRYRFDTVPFDYFSREGIFTGLGYRQAYCFLIGYIRGYDKGYDNGKLALASRL